MPGRSASRWRAAHGLEVGHRGRVELHDQIEAALTLEHLRDDPAGERRLHGAGNVRGAQAVAGERGAVEADGDLRDVGLLLDREVDQAEDVLNDCLDAGGDPAQLVEVVAEDFNCDVGPRADSPWGSRLLLRFVVEGNRCPVLPFIPRRAPGAPCVAGALCPNLVEKGSRA